MARMGTLHQDAPSRLFFGICTYEISPPLISPAQPQLLLAQNALKSDPVQGVHPILLKLWATALVQPHPQIRWDTRLDHACLVLHSFNPGQWCSWPLALLSRPLLLQSVRSYRVPLSTCLYAHHGLLCRCLERRLEDFLAR